MNHKSMLRALQRSSRCSIKSILSFTGCLSELLIHSLFVSRIKVNHHHFDCICREVQGSPFDAFDGFGCPRGTFSYMILLQEGAHMLSLLCTPAKPDIIFRKIGVCVVELCCYSRLPVRNILVSLQTRCCAAPRCPK
jgi:hypothetical protein